MLKCGLSTSYSQTIRNRAAKPSVLQQAAPPPRILLHGFHGQKGPLLHLAAGPDQSQPWPDPHGLRRIRRHRAAGLVRHQQSIGGRELAILPNVNLQSLRVGDDEAHVGLSPPREAPTGLPHGSGQRDLLRLVDSQPSQELEDPLVEAPALREVVAPARSSDGGPLGAAERAQRPLQRHLAGHRRTHSIRYFIVG